MEPVDVMWHHPHPRKNLKNDQVPRADMEKIMPSQTSQSLKLPDKPKSGKPASQSYVHNEIDKNIDDNPSVPPRWAHRNEWIEERAAKEAELVKYMSNLPCYLQRVERGENLQGKALNFGVLDWGRLENWKHNQKQIPGKTTISSSSTCNSSSSLSTVGPSRFCSRQDAESSSHHRTLSTLLHSHLTSISRESHSQGDERSRENAKNSQDLKIFCKNPLVSQGKISRTDYSAGTKLAEIKVEHPKGKYSDPNIICDLGPASSNSENNKASFFSKGKVKGGKAESTNVTERYCEYRLPDQQCPGKQKTIVLLLPKNPTKDCCSGISRKFESTTVYDRKPTEANRQSFSESFYANKEVQFTNLDSDIPHSCPLPRSFESSKMLVMKQCSSTNSQGGKVTFDASHSLPGSDEIPEEKNSVATPSNRLALKTVVTKGRCLSSTHPSTIALGQMKRCPSSKEVSAVPQLNSTYVSVKSGPARSDATSCMDNSDRENNRANSRGRSSSPLKRLLDPLLKSRSVNRHHSLESVQDESSSMHNAWRSSEETLDSSKVTPIKRNLHFSSSKPTSADGSDQAEKHEMVQALLKVTVKDGLQSLAFAVDNNSNILVATMKKTSMSGKYDCSWIYTFYSFHKIKKKSGGWINQGTKGKTHDFAPKMVGQMKVSGSHGPESIRHDSKDPFLIREFVLLGVEQRQAGKKIDLQQHNELAAIVVKVPKCTTGNLSGDGWLSANYENVAEMEFPECFPEERGSCKSRENPQYEPCIRSQSLSNTIVILPSGDHGLPANGVPSPLISRWRSGGSCDCGGWDVGCNLRILACEDQSSKNSGSSDDFCSPEHFVLFFEGGAAQEKRPVFTLGTFKGGICSVNFSASISSLQAFSICAALLHCMKLAELSEVSNLIEDKVSQDFTNTINSRIKVPTQVEVDTPPTYIPFPPLSPVGRV